MDHLILHVFKYNGSGDLGTHHPVIINNHAVALMTGLVPDRAECIGGSEPGSRTFLLVENRLCFENPGAVVDVTGASLRRE